MYGIRNLMQKSPSVISAAIFTVVNFIAGCIFVSMNVEPTPEFTGLMLQGETALILVLNLFVVQPNTVTNSQAADQVSSAVTARETEIVSYLAEANPPNVDQKVAEKVVSTSKRARRA